MPRFDRKPRLRAASLPTEDTSSRRPLKAPPEDAPLRRKSVGGDVQDVETSLEMALLALRSSPGRPLDAEIRSYFEPRFGHDFGDVRVHTEGRAAETAQPLGALAFTLGKDIVVREGLYAPYSSEGRQLLAHELAHVVQQRGAGRRQRG